MAKQNTKLAEVYHFDLYGKREEKYDFLLNNSIDSINWNKLNPEEPMFFFTNKDFDLKKEYDKGFSVNELFMVNNVGIVTARDGFTIHNSKQEVENTIVEFLKLDDEEARIKFNLGKDVRDWQVNFAKKDLQKHFPNEGVFTKISYRPFDNKWTFYTGKSKGFHCYPRADVMQHFLKGENVGLTLCKQFKTGENYVHAFITNKIIESSYVSNRTSEITSTFPLYLYPETTPQQTIGQTIERTPNLNTEITLKIARSIRYMYDAKVSSVYFSYRDTGVTLIAPIDILDYIYAVLHSPTYREKYKEFLKIDFPIIPYPKNKATFWQLVKLGGELRQIHLLESPTVEKYITQYPIDGDNVIIKPNYQNSKVYINDTQYFDNVPEIAWNFYIGGYQPAQKWLKDRKDRKLEFDDILHYQKIIVALSETDRLMKEIDNIEIE